MNKKEKNREKKETERRRETRAKKETEKDRVEGRKGERDCFDV